MDAFLRDIGKWVRFEEIMRLSMCPSGCEWVEVNGSGVEAALTFLLACGMFGGWLVVLCRAVGTMISSICLV